MYRCLQRHQHAAPCQCQLHQPQLQHILVHQLRPGYRKISRIQLFTFALLRTCVCVCAELVCVLTELACPESVQVNQLDNSSLLVLMESK